MKITIWIHKTEAISGNITNYAFTRPYHDRNEEWVQVQITQDEFTRLEDTGYKIKYDSFDEVLQELKQWFSGLSPIHQKVLGDTYGMFFNVMEEKPERDDEWLVDQYNRNREVKDHITDIDEIDQNNQPFGD